MCGPYIHGRSWWDENIKGWSHFCEPYKINAHCEMPVPGNIERHELLYDDAMNVWQQAREYQDSRRGASTLRPNPMIKVASFSPNWQAVQPLHNMHLVGDDTVSFKESYIYLCEVVGIDSEMDTRIHTVRYYICVKKEPSEVVDWGIKPWDGQVVHQRSKSGIPVMQPKLIGGIGERDFFPTTQADLTQWVKNHWGKRQDEDEFIFSMSKCLNYQKLKPKLSPCMLEYNESSMHDAILTVRGRHVGIISNFEASFDKDEYHLAHAISNATNPVDRWAEMFKEAPNEFWAVKN